MGWCKYLSHHRPISVRQEVEGMKDVGRKPIPDWLTKAEGLDKKVAIALNLAILQRQPTQDTTNPFTRLLIAKETMVQVASTVLKTEQAPASLEITDKITYTMRTVKALEKGNWGAIRANIKAYKELCTVIGYNEDEWAQAAKLQAVKDHALKLAREEVQIDLTDLRSTPEHAVPSKKENLLRKLKKLMPGSAQGIAAVQNPDNLDEITTDPDEKVNLLSQALEMSIEL